jgi:hypothetical protein
LYITRINENLKDLLKVEETQLILNHNKIYFKKLTVKYYTNLFLITIKKYIYFILKY